MGREGPRMSEFTFQAIAPLLVYRNLDQQRDVICCVFACPLSGRRFNSESPMQPTREGIERVSERLQDRFWFQLRRGVLDLLSSLVGSELVRTLARDSGEGMAIGRAQLERQPRHSLQPGYPGQPGYPDHPQFQYAPGDPRQPRYSIEDVNQATLRAFDSVSFEFVHDGTKWVGREVSDSVVAEFYEQLREHPITSEQDRELTTRCLASLAGFGGLHGSEREILERFSPAGPDRRTTGPPSAAELARLGPGVAATIYMLCQTLVLADEIESSAERKGMAELRLRLGLDATTATRVEAAARRLFLEQALRKRKSLFSAEKRALAARLGLHESEIDAMLEKLP